jgi:hypothetical protein
MKRAFFFGLGVSLILVGVALLSVGHVAMPTRETFAWAWASSTEGDQRWGSIAVGLIAVLASGIAIWAAKHSPPSHSWMIAILFWMLGYLATGVLLVPFVVAFVLTNQNMTYIECLHNAARKTDDGRSDAITIAMAIKSANDDIEMVNCVEVFVGEHFIDERPKVLGQLQLAAVGWLVNEPDAVGNCEVFRCVPPGIVALEHDDAVAHGAGGACEGFEQLSKEGFVDAVRQELDGLAVGRPYPATRHDQQQHAITACFSHSFQKHSSVQLDAGRRAVMSRMGHYSRELV